MARRNRKPSNPTDIVDPRFEGSAYSNQELAFLIEHFGEPAIVAMPPEEDLPEGVNEDAVGPILDRTHQLELFQRSLQDKHDDSSIRIWCGFDALKDICQKTLEWNATVQELKRRTKGQSAEIRRAAGAPSLHMWDASTDTPYLGGVGADAERTLTAIGPDGRRHELYINLQQMGVGSIKTMTGVAALIKGRQDVENLSNKLHETTPEELLVEEGETFGAVACPICKKSEPYEVGKSNTKRKAQAAIMRHLTEERHVRVDQHRLLHTRLKGGRAGAARNRVPAGAAAVAEE